jgi:hypothetical protein
MPDIDDSRIKLDPANFWLLTFFAFCKGLPGVKPLSTQRKLDTAYFEALAAEQSDANVAGTAVPVSALAELHCLNVFNSRAITPKGGALLVELYTAGLLDTGDKALGKPGANALRYAGAQDIWLAFRDVGMDQQRAVILANMDYDTRLRDLAAWDESDFSFKQLTDIFWANRGGEDGELVIAGIEVSRGFVRQTNRSGKYVDYKGAFSWKGSTGILHVLTKDVSKE